MPIYQTAHYQVKAAGVESVKAAITEFVDYVTTHEPGTRMYLALAAARRPHPVRPPLHVRGRASPQGPWQL